jgi:hypothetical protein
MKLYTYKDNSQNGKVIYECYADSILEADEKFQTALGFNVAKVSYIGCVITTHFAF